MTKNLIIEVKDLDSIILDVSGIEIKTSTGIISLKEAQERAIREIKETFLEDTFYNTKIGDRSIRQIIDTINEYIYMSILSRKEEVTFTFSLLECPFSSLGGWSHFVTKVGEKDTKDIKMKLVEINSQESNTLSSKEIIYLKFIYKVLNDLKKGGVYYSISKRSNSVIPCITLYWGSKIKEYEEIKE